MLNKPLVLVVDNDRPHVAGLIQWLHDAGYDSATAEDGLSGLRQFFNLHADIVIVDTEVLDIPGWQVVERIREIVDTPIVVTASEASAEALKRGFDLNVDGFLVKPIDKSNVLRRLRTITERRVNGAREGSWLFRSNGLSVDWRSCEVFVQDQPVSLTGTEFKLLAYLIERRGWVSSHEQILNHVWGIDHVGDANQVRLYIWYLRHKIEDDPSNPRLVLTKRGLGYAFAG